jgi:PAS domain S-box-containing protein
MQANRFSISVISIKHRLPLLIGALLLGIIVASTWTSYSGVKESALAVGRERLQNVTRQLGILLQQSNSLLLTRTFTIANDAAIKAFLQSPSPATRSSASAILQQLKPPQDENSLQVELWNTNHSLVLTVPDGASPESLDLEAEFKGAGVDPFKTSSPMRVVKDVIVAPGVAAVKDNSGKPIGYLVWWRRTSLNPAPKQLTDLLGSDAALYFGNIRGDLFTDLDRVVSKPRADLGSTGEVMEYSRDGNRVLALGRPISGTPWFLVIEFPEQPLLVPAHRFLRRILVADVVVFIIGIVGAFVLSRGITQPLQVLTEAASAIGAGDYSRRVDLHRDDELGALANAFNAMVSKTRNSQLDLEEQARILDMAPVMIRDLNGRILFWSTGVEQMFGWKAEEALEKISHNLLKTEFPRPLEEIKARLYADGHWEGETVHTRKDGKQVVIASQWVLHRDEQDKPQAILVVNNDITERKQAEREIRLLNEELEGRVADRTAQLKAANKELEAFSYSVSHDLRAPLRHIDGFSQALLEDYADKLDEEGKGYLREVRGASQEMAQLIDDVLQLARVTRSEMRREEVNLTELASGVVAELKKTDGRRKITINVAEGLSTRGDRRLLRIVLTNLLGNSWKFTSRRKSAEIAFGEANENGESFYFVRDNGAGFDMAYANKLFGAFQRLHTTREFEGTGIGLATVQRIVHRHGGRVWAEGKVDQGATFFFTLPNSKESGDGEQGDLTG